MKTVFLYLALAAANAPCVFRGEAINALAFGWLLGLTYCRLLELMFKSHA